MHPLKSWLLDFVAATDGLVGLARYHSSMGAQRPYTGRAGQAVRHHSDGLEAVGACAHCELRCRAVFTARAVHECCGGAPPAQHAVLLLSTGCYTVNCAQCRSCWTCTCAHALSSWCHRPAEHKLCLSRGLYAGTQIVWTYILSQAAASGDEEPVAIESAGGGGEIDESIEHRKARALAWGRSH